METVHASDPDDDSLNEGERLLRAITERLPVLVSYIGPDMRFRFVNGELARSFGVDPTWAVGRHVREVTGDEVFEVARPHLERALAGFPVTFTRPAKLLEGERMIESRYIPDIAPTGEVRGIVTHTRELTSQLAAEASLARERAMLDRTLETAEVATWLWDIANDRVHANPLLQRIFGVSHEDARGGPIRTYLDRIHPEDQVNVQCVIEHAIASGEKYEVEYRILGADRDHWVLARGHTEYDEAGKPATLSGILLDLTERKREETLQAAQKRVLELIIKDTPLQEILETLVRFVEDHSGAKTLAAISLVENDRLKYGAAPSLPRVYNEAIDGLPIGIGVGSCGTAAFTKQAVFVSDIQTDPLWADYSGLAAEHGLRACWSTPIKSGDGNVLGVLAMYFRETRKPDSDDLNVIEVITQTAAIAIERYRAERSIRESEEQLRTIFDSAEDDAIILADQDRTILAWNRAAERICGWTAEEAVGQTADIIFTPSDREANVPDREAEIAKTRGKALDERWHYRKDDKVFWGSGTMNALRRDDGSVRGFVKIFRDATERYEMERKIRQLNDELEERVERRTADLVTKNQELEGFTYSVSHDMRTPLRGIVSNSRMVLEEEGDRVTEEGRLRLERLVHNSLRMAQLVDDLLKYARLGTRELQRSEVDLSLLAQETLAAVRSDYPECDFEVTIQPGLTAHCDARLIGMALQSLFDNSCKYRHPDRKPTISFGARDGERETVYVLRDNGIGFDMNYLSKLFIPFERLHREEYAGTGIGLANARRAVERHGGRIWAEGALGEGATFYFTLG